MSLCRVGQGKRAFVVLFADRQYFGISFFCAGRFSHDSRYLDFFGATRMQDNPKPEPLAGPHASIMCSLTNSL